MKQTYRFIYSGKMDKTPVFSMQDLYLATYADKEQLENLDFFEKDEVERFLREASIYIYRINGEYVSCGTFLIPFWREDIPDIEKSKYRDIGMHVSEDFRGIGFGRSMVQNLTLMAIESGFIPITECETGNTASRSTLESAGYLLSLPKEAKTVKEQIRDNILRLGADVCGFAATDRFSNAPKGFHPKDIYGECQTVIVIAVALPKGLLHIDSRLIYAHFNDISCPMVDKIAFQTAIFIEKNYNKIAVPLPCDCPYEYWDEERMEGRGLISMKHAAEQAGLGRIGKNSLLLNKQYGNMLTIGAILTNLEITSDPLSESVCIDSCNLCINNCPVKALDGIGAKQKECRMNTFGNTKRGFGTVDCNICRSICPKRYGD